MSGKIPMTREGYEALREELKRLKGIERPKIVKEIGVAREHGDLSENAEYHAAREQQGMVEARIRDIEGRLSNAQVIDVLRLVGARDAYMARAFVWRYTVCALAGAAAIAADSPIPNSIFFIITASS